ncbi:hypothetical protein OS493_000637 [Desmophyllum pertusum]|uniref:Uncharacterized protein n=1 Tax=Desmophyllum pertusum TaxID=174260 RepID=A0A9X0A7E8_9CNID|nr:hypothetical protein OS493_000637 [Desmophyllum pertusum]
MGMDIAAGRGEKDPAAKASRSFRQDSASREGYKDKKTMGFQNFRELLENLNKEEIDEDDITTFKAKALSWGKDMVAMSGTGPGYQHTVIITPYMHSMIYHVPVMMTKHGSLRQFSDQGVEKKNDDLRRYFNRKINRWDTAKNLLLVESKAPMSQLSM